MTRFVVGTRGLSPESLRALAQEQQRFGDLALVSSDDHYQALTQKVVAGFAWATQNFRFQHLFKVRGGQVLCVPFFSRCLVLRNLPVLCALQADDDTFVRLDRVVQELDTSLPA